MSRIKIFESFNIGDLEFRINEWCEKNHDNVVVEDIRINPSSEYTWYAYIRYYEIVEDDEQ